MQNTKTQFNANTQDIYQQVTDLIIEQLEQGVIPWQQPWKGGTPQYLNLPFNFTTGNEYKGINILLLWCSAIKNNFETPEWATFKQWQEKNETIQKGAKGSLIIKYDTIDKEVEGEIEKIPYIKKYYVFNRSQLASYQPSKEVEPVIDTFNFQIKIEGIDDFICNTHAIIESHNQGACYRPKDDKIMMPYPEMFFPTSTCTATEGYYSTLLHELVHWSGARSRLNRTESRKLDNGAYANEELVAEFGAAFLCAGFGITTVEKGDHASYIQGWLKALRDDKRCIFRAAGEATKAVTYLHGLQPS